MTLIDRDEFLHDIYCLFDIENFLSLNKSMITQIVNRQPVTEAESVVHGYWRLNETGSIECSNCYSQDDRIYGFCNSNDFEYCPWCGAKMDEVTE